QQSICSKVFVPEGAGEPPEGWHPVDGFDKDSPFYLNYMVATISEWTTALAMQIFVLSFVVELQNAYAHAPRVIFRRNSQDCSELETRQTKISHDLLAVYPL
ncbi:hypothetical protein OSTOST_05567, partial [Ostertagia ostertagi]